MSSLRLIALVALVSACAGSRARVRVVPPDDGRFALRFASRSGGLSYDVETLRDVITRMEPDAFTITLRADAIERFITHPSPALCVRLVLTEAGARRLRDDASARRERSQRHLERDLDGMVFVAEFDGHRLFEGQVWNALGAAAFDTPAMHPVDAPAPGALVLVPNQGMWNALGPGGRSMIDQPSLREYFRARGVFEERRGCVTE